jgi:hypothetical protein
LYRPTTQPPTFSTASAASAVVPSCRSNRHSAGSKPLEPGLALRGRRRAGARLGIVETLSYLQENCSSWASVFEQHLALSDRYR